MEAKANYATAKAALRKRFEPDSRRDLCVVEFQTRKRNRGEAWEELAYSLRLLADEAFPYLQDETKEQLSLDRFLTSLDKPELALAVKQKRPKSIDEAVTYTLEMESYMMTTGSTQPAAVTAAILKQEVDTQSTQLQSETAISVAAVLSKQDEMMDMLHNFNIYLQHLERIVDSENKSHTYPAPSKKPLEQLEQPSICQKCGQAGHFAWECAQHKAGND